MKKKSSKGRMSAGKSLARKMGAGLPSNKGMMPNRPVPQGMMTKGAC